MKFRHSKKYICFVMFLVISISLTGCWKKRIISSYSEWIDALGINEYPNIECFSYHEYEDGVYLSIKEFKSEFAEEFAKIIDNHNAFVKRNPDYFPEDFDIEIQFVRFGGDMIMHFTNYAESIHFGTWEENQEGRIYCGDWAPYVNLDSIETEKSSLMRYAFVRADLDMLLDGNDTKFEAETIILSAGIYDASTHFTGCERIVANFSLETENTETLEELRELNPGLDIYYNCYSKELTKYEPEGNTK